MIGHICIHDIPLDQDCEACGLPNNADRGALRQQLDKRPAADAAVCQCGHPHYMGVYGPDSCGQCRCLTFTVADVPCHCGHPQHDTVCGVSTGPKNSHFCHCSGPPEARFWAKVDKRGECWLWTAHLDHAGYGGFRLGDVMVKAHRYAYEQVIGPIPDDLPLDHLCRNRWCVNPAHLEPVTPAENQNRQMAAIYAETCKRGHPWTEESTSYSTSRTGNTVRECVICRRERKRRRYQERKGEGA